MIFNFPFCEFNHLNILEGRIFHRFGYKAIYDATSSYGATVSSIPRNSNWFWNHTRSDDLVTIQSKLCPIELQDEDKPIWFPTKSGTQTCANA